VKRAVSTFVNHLHEAETYDEREGATLGRIHIERRFQGDLEGEATAELLTATAEDGTAVYLALDRISGRLDDKEGSFVLQHRGVLSADGAEIDGAIVPGSGTGELKGITGHGAITVDDEGTHRLTLEYELT
jgi:Protein of unknown function (DUF3224)